MISSVHQGFTDPAINLFINQINSILEPKEQRESPTGDLGTFNRVKLVGIVASLERQGSITTLLIDDSTGTINAKVFEENKEVQKIERGNTVMLIGKIRKYNLQYYFAPDIIRLVNPLWLKLRLLSSNNLPFLKTPQEKIETDFSVVKKRVEPSNALPTETFNKDQTFPIERLIELIKCMDTGEGVLIEEVISASPLPDTEKLLDKMLEQGDIFQNLPGRVKVL